RQIRNAAKRRIGWQSIRNGLEDVGKDRPVENVEEFRTELQLVALREVEVLRQIHIREELAREAERRPRRISNLPRQRRAESKRIECIRNAAACILRDVSQRIADDIRTG